MKYCGNATAVAGPTAALAPTMALITAANTAAACSGQYRSGLSRSSLGLLVESLPYK